MAAQRPTDTHSRADDLASEMPNVALLHPRTTLDALERIGAATRSGLRAVGAEARFVGTSAVSLRELTTWPRHAVEQARRLGVDSLPIALFIAVFTGIVLAL